MYYNIRMFYVLKVGYGVWGTEDICAC